MSLNTLSLVVDNTCSKPLPVVVAFAKEKHSDANDMAQKTEKALLKTGLSTRRCPIELAAFYLDPLELFAAALSDVQKQIEQGSVLIAARSTGGEKATPNRLVGEVRLLAQGLRGLSLQEKLEISAEISRTLDFGSVTWASPGYGSCGYLSYQLCVPLAAHGPITGDLAEWLLDMMRAEIAEVMHRTSYFAQAYQSR